MDMNRPLHVLIAALFVVSMKPVSVAQSHQCRYDPAPRQRDSKAQDSFLDFTLKRINPTNIDYGQRLAEQRTWVFEETIKSSYFWSNIVTLSLLVGLFIIIVYQHRIQTEREWASAEVLAQFEHSLLRANAQIDEATKKNHQLTETLAALRESGLRSPFQVAASATPAASSSARTRNITVPATLPNSDSTKPVDGRASETRTAPQTADQMRLFTSDADLIVKVNSLEQQLAHSQDDNKQLRRRLADGDRRLEAEQQRNRQLKGA
jgi:septal ring factor EnvC (AmiA/AmiB activator)